MNCKSYVELIDSETTIRAIESEFLPFGSGHQFVAEVPGLVVRLTPWQTRHWGWRALRSAVGEVAWSCQRLPWAGISIGV